MTVEPKRSQAPNVEHDTGATMEDRPATVVTVIYTPTFTGAHNQVLRLYQPMLEQGWRHVVVLPTEPGNAAQRLLDAGIDVVKIPLSRPRRTPSLGTHLRFALCFPQEVVELRRFFRSTRPEVVQVCGAMYLQAGIAAHLDETPLVWQLLSTFAPAPVRRIVTPLIVRCADVVMCTGIDVGRRHPGVEKLGKRLMHFLPPVDTREFRPDQDRREVARSALGIRRDELLIGTVGTLAWQKGHDQFVVAAARVARRCSHVRFVILGPSTSSNSGWFERRVLEPARAMGLLSNDLLQIRDPGAAVSELLPAFDLFLLSSRAEGLPTAVMEAMSCGIPVVVSDVGSTRELVDECVTGRVVRPADPYLIADTVSDLIRDRPRLRTMGEAARKQAVRRFGLAQCADDHIRAFQLAMTHRCTARKRAHQSDVL